MSKGHFDDRPTMKAVYVLFLDYYREKCTNPQGVEMGADVHTHLKVECRTGEMAWNADGRSTVYGVPIYVDTSTGASRRQFVTRLTRLKDTGYNVALGQGV